MSQRLIQFYTGQVMSKARMTQQVGGGAQPKFSPGHALYFGYKCDQRLGKDIDL